MTRHRSVGAWIAVGCLSFVGLGCRAVLTSPDGNGASGGENDGELPEDCSPRIPQDLILLGELPFVNSLRSLFGPEALEGRLIPEAHSKIFSQKGIVANTSLVNSRLDWAIHATNSLTGRVTEVTGCADGDEACARSYLERIAHRAFRRPVAAAELEDLMVVYRLGNATSFDEGVRLALQALLVSPSFNHRTEYGVDRGDGTFELTPHEFASSLSFLLTDTLPDEQLLAAADSGALAGVAEKEAQAARLVAETTTRESVEKTLMAAWNLGNLFGKVKDPTLYPEFSGALASQMYRETELFLRKYLWNGPLTEALTTRRSFVNGALASLYGIPFPGTDETQFVEVDLPSETRVGLMTQASLLTTFSRTDQTSVVARGLFVNGPLLCLPKIGSPPEAAIAAIEEQLSNDVSERERAAFRAGTSPCRNCHDQFDAFGLMFETYDAIGRYRATEDGETIDPSVDLTKMSAFEGVFPNVVAFAEHLGTRTDFVECVTRHMLAYGTGEDGLKRSDCEVREVLANLSPESSLSDILLAIARSEDMRVRVIANETTTTPTPTEEDE